MVNKFLIRTVLKGILGQFFFEVPSTDNRQIHHQSVTLYTLLSSWVPYITKIHDFFTDMVRPILGNFSSIVCLKAVITGTENALGEKAAAIALISAGRSRGKKLAKELDLVNSSVSWENLTLKLANALGENGTRLCLINKIVQENDVIKVYTSETVCSAGEPFGSTRKCTYTLGAVWGALEETIGKRLQGNHTESVLRGNNYDVFEFSELV